MIPNDVMAAKARASGTDGYGFMDHMGSIGYRAIAGWGADGWDLLEWPYYIAFVRKHHVDGPGFELVTYCEGDLTHETFATREELYVRIDDLAVFHWRAHPGSGPPGLPAEGPVDAALLGPWRSAVA